jgi:hypothetical protein
MEALNFKVRRIGDPNIERMVQVFGPLCMNGKKGRQQANRRAFFSTCYFI